MIVQGAIGFMDPARAAIPDVDFYSFEGWAGNSITVDIDGGIKPVATTTLRHVDTIVALFRPVAGGTWEVLLQNDNTASIDEGRLRSAVSATRLDNRRWRCPWTARTSSGSTAPLVP
jgi:hypothetical protein